MSSHHPLETTEEADQWLAHKGPAWLLKYSNTCSFSDWALGEMAAFLSEQPDLPAAMVTVQTHRPVSNHIAETTGIRHETPQAMLIRDGKVVWHASHGKITASAMREALR